MRGLTVIGMVLLAGCAGLKPMFTAKNGNDGDPYSVSMLQNMDYTLPEIGSIHLKNGRCQEKPSEDSATFVTNVKLQRDYIRFGDLVGEASGGAAAILTDSPGGSGVFYYLAVVITDADEPRNIDTAFLGDRIRIEGMSVIGRRIIIHVLEHGPEDPRCCPTVQVTREYKVVDGRIERKYTS